MRLNLIATLAAASTIALAGCGSSSSSTSTAAPAASTSTSKSAAPAASASSGATDMKPGAYLSKADYESQMTARAGTKVVLFFHASWCPSCKGTDESLTTAGVPAGLTVVKVDYDTATDLKKQYGITQQHTFVQIDGDGKALATWSGTKTGEDIKAKTV